MRSCSIRKLNKTRRWGREIDKQLAKAVSDSHPQIALQIWKAIADGLIAQVKPEPTKKPPAT